MAAGRAAALRAHGPRVASRNPDARARSNSTDSADKVACGPDSRPVLDKIDEYSKAGFTHVYLHPVGPDKEGFLRFAEGEVLPEFAPATRR